MNLILNNEFVGHKHVGTTMIYTRVAPRSEEYQKFAGCALSPFGTAVQYATSTVNKQIGGMSRSLCVTKG